MPLQCDYRTQQADEREPCPQLFALRIGAGTVLASTHAWPVHSCRGALTAAAAATDGRCCRAEGGIEAERAERVRQKEEAAAEDRRNFEWLQQLRREGFRKVQTHTAAAHMGKQNALWWWQAQTSRPTCVRAHLSPHATR